MDGLNIIFRSLEEDDWEIVKKINNDQLVKEMYSGHPFPVGKRATINWINNVANPDFKLSLFGIDSPSGLVGICGLKNISQINHSAELFILIDSEQRGKGYAKLSIAKLIEFGFNSLNLNRIFLNVQANNSKAIGLYKKLRFTKEGVLRKAIFKDGKYIDIIVMSYLKEDFCSK
ncbi:MAG: hypothetical protein CR982_09910 [Candidatus Cloacimonadota bacterium]|nr:MAG: hypothetical protein CR982_09910 [Candidatus Cloacimonadota bacterium]PIE78720.1 MAG: hypothetical protein CSA15_06240 [Candidatus Delongbacteria bacterium]